jgi:hypothetical protein
MNKAQYVTWRAKIHVLTRIDRGKPNLIWSVVAVRVTRQCIGSLHSGVWKVLLHDAGLLRMGRNTIQYTSHWMVRSNTMTLGIKAKRITSWTRSNSLADGYLSLAARCLLLNNGDATTHQDGQIQCKYPFQCKYCLIKHLLCVCHGRQGLSVLVGAPFDCGCYVSSRLLLGVCHPLCGRRVSAKLVIGWLAPTAPKRSNLTPPSAPLRGRHALLDASLTSLRGRVVQSNWVR